MLTYLRFLIAVLVGRVDMALVPVRASLSYKPEEILTSKRPSALLTLLDVNRFAILIP